MAKIGLIGGTGREGRGLALRFALAGEQVIIGSRVRERAESAALALREKASGLDSIFAATNEDAAREADSACICLPAAGVAATLIDLRAALRGKIVIEVVNPVIRTAEGFVLTALEGVPSAAELTAMLLPESDVVAAFKTIGARHLLDVPKPLRGDALICADSPAAKRLAIDLAGRMPELRAVDCGPLRNARYAEATTALLLEINRIHAATTSLRVLDLKNAERQPGH
jgi:NADPH-dependent F420 reductase